MKKSKIKLVHLKESEGKRKKFIASFKRLKGDKELLALAEEGIEDFKKMLDEYEAK